MSERPVPRNPVKLIPAGKGVKKRQAILKLSGGGEVIITRQRADGQTVGFAQGRGFKTLNVEDLLSALLYVTKTDEELEAMKNAGDSKVSE